MAECIPCLSCAKGVIRWLRGPTGADRCPHCGYEQGVSAETEWIEEGAKVADDDYDDERGDELECTHCGGEGFCDSGADPLGNCPDELHRCHACGGSGDRKDQTVF